MKNDKIIYACKEHVEMAIDDYINAANDEKAPNMVICKDNKCDYCEMNAEYKISE